MCQIRVPYACILVLFVVFPRFSATKTSFFEVYGSEKGGVYFQKVFQKSISNKPPSRKVNIPIQRVYLDAYQKTDLFSELRDLTVNWVL